MTRLKDDPARLREALTTTRGNITRAAKVLGVTKTYVVILVRRFGLNDWARELRKQAGAPDRGRPSKATSVALFGCSDRVP